MRRRLPIEPVEVFAVVLAVLGAIVAVLLAILIYTGPVLP